MAKVDTSFLSVRGFQEKVNEKLPNSATLREAYEKVEEEYREIFGTRRYSDYHSFRQVRRRVIQKSGH